MTSQPGGPGAGRYPRVLVMVKDSYTLSPDGADPGLPTFVTPPVGHPGCNKREVVSKRKICCWLRLWREKVVVFKWLVPFPCEASCCHFQPAGTLPREALFVFNPEMLPRAQPSPFSPRWCSPNKQAHMWATEGPPDKQAHMWAAEGPPDKQAHMWTTEGPQISRPM